MTRHGIQIVVIVQVTFIFWAVLSTSCLAWTSVQNVVENRNGRRALGCSSFALRRRDEVVLPADEEKNSMLPKGIPDGFFVVKQYPVPENYFDHSTLTTSGMLNANQVQRLRLTTVNSTVAVALMMADPQEYATLSRARRACRKGIILLHRGRLSNDTTSFDDPAKCSRGRVGDRVFPGDVIAVQKRMSHGSYSSFIGHAKPSFDLPVVYEDDHFAIVNKPAGVLVHQEADKGFANVKFALPYVLTPPPRSKAMVDEGRPQPVHRLDKPTSGLLVVGKTLQAVTNLCRQFEDRIVNKTYTAIVNGSLSHTNEFAQERDDTDAGWQLARNILDGKEAVTLWRVLGTFKSLRAKDDCLTLVELNPKTGRYHQLRRQLAWMYDTPIIGDSTYGATTQDYQAKRWHRGLMLCSNEISLLHPYYNTPSGRDEWDRLDDEAKERSGVLKESHDGEVLVSVSIDVPSKFAKFLEGEEKRAMYAS